MNTSTFETDAGRRHARKLEYNFDEVDEGVFWTGMICHQATKEARRLLADLERFNQRAPTGIP